VSRCSLFTSRRCPTTVSATAARSVASIAWVFASLIICRAVVSCTASTAVVPSGGVGVAGYWSASDTDETSHGAFLASPDRCPTIVPVVTARRIVFADLSTRVAASRIVNHSTLSGSVSMLVPSRIGYAAGILAGWCPTGKDPCRVGCPYRAGWTRCLTPVYSRPIMCMAGWQDYRKGISMLVTTHDDGGLADPATMERVERLLERRTKIRAAARSPRTLTAYRSDWRLFASWAAGFGMKLPDDPTTITEPVAVGVVEAYLLDRSDPDGVGQIAPQTLAHHLSAIKWWHRQAGLVSPTDHPSLADTIAGIRRVESVPVRRAAPVYLDDLRAMAATMSDDPASVRDRALLTVGWWGAFRRSELVGITAADVTDDPSGVIVNLPRSKTDQEGEGREVPLHYHDGPVCPVVSLRSWRRFYGDAGGPVFAAVDRWGNIGGPLTGRAVSRVVKQYAAAIGFDPAGYSGHSLRAGFVSECDRRGIVTSAVRLVTGHQSDAMLSVYTRPRSLFESSAGAFFD